MSSKMKSATCLSWPITTKFSRLVACIILHLDFVCNDVQITDKVQLSVSVKTITFTWDPNTQLDHEKRKMRRKQGRYSTSTSLIVALMKRLAPVGLRVCFPSDHSVIILAKHAFSQVSWKCRQYILCLVHISLSIIHNVGNYMLSTEEHWERDPRPYFQMLCASSESGNGCFYFFDLAPQSKIIWKAWSIWQASRSKFRQMIRQNNKQICIGCMNSCFGLSSECKWRASFLFSEGIHHILGYARVQSKY